MLNRDFPQTNPARWHTALGLAFNKEGRFEDARREFRKALTFSPDDEDIAWMYACLEGSRGDGHPAVEACRNVLRIDPYKIECHQALAQLYAQLGQDDLARQHQAFALRLMEHPQP